MTFKEGAEFPWNKKNPEAEQKKDGNFVEVSPGVWVANEAEEGKSIGVAEAASVDAERDTTMEPEERGGFLRNESGTRSQDRGPRLTSENAQMLAGMTEDFDVEKALNTKGFAEFIARHEDAKQGEVGPEAMHERFQIFEMQNEVAKEIKDIYKKEISEEIGISLDSRDLECINTFIQEQAVDDPNTIFLMRDQIEQYRELPQQIEAVKKEVELLDAAKEGTGIWGKTKMYAGLAFGALTGKSGKSSETYWSQQEVKASGVPISAEGIEKRRMELIGMTQKTEGEITASEENPSQLKELLEELGHVKKELFAHAGLREQIQEISLKKLKNKLESTALSGGVEGYSKAHDELSSKGVGENTGLEYVDSDNEDEIRDALDTHAEKYIGKMVDASLRELKFGEGSFTKFENSLRELIDAQSAGSKSQEETRGFVIDSIHSAADSLSDDAEGRAKKLFARQLALKLERSGVEQYA